MCGVIGVYGTNYVTDLTLDTMEALQHRGHQSAGCVLIAENNDVINERELGIIPNLIQKLKISRSSFKALLGLGHLRYGTAGSKDTMENAQPFYINQNSWELYISHNGDTPLYKEMKQELLDQGRIFTTSSDTECIAHYIGMSKEEDPINAILEGLANYRGTYAIALLLKYKNEWKLIAARDHSGNRPLSLGSYEDAWLLASEDVAFEAVDAKKIEEIAPGKLLIISRDGLFRKDIPKKTWTPKKTSYCIFENIYFSFPNSVTYGVPVGKFQEQLGIIVARNLINLIQENDIIINIPDSSNLFMDGFSKELDKFPTRAIIRKHNYRSFTEASQFQRESVIRKKHSFSGERVLGKRVWVLDDSIVRGNTSRRIIRALRNHGATWVGMVSSAPPIIGQCKKGIDFENDLVAAKYLNKRNVSASDISNIEKIKEEIEADYLYYTKQEDLDAALVACGANPINFCNGCFSGKEPVFGAW